MRIASDVIIARGHANITARNKRTLEVTRDPYVTKSGDCIVACCADKAGPLLARELREALKMPGVVEAIIEAGGVEEVVRGRTPLSAPDNPYRLVIRRSNFVDDSTLMISADKAAADLSRELIEALRKEIIAKITIRAWTSEDFW
ncbi:MAG: DUF371 domain-containing protein [Thermoproteus sp.]